MSPTATVSPQTVTGPPTASRVRQRVGISPHVALRGRPGAEDPIAPRNSDAYGGNPIVVFPQPGRKEAGGSAPEAWMVHRNRRFGEGRRSRASGLLPRRPPAVRS